MNLLEPLGTDKKRLFAIGFIAGILQTLLEMFAIEAKLRHLIPYNYIDTVVQLLALGSFILLVEFVIRRYNVQIPGQKEKEEFFVQSFILIALGAVLGGVIGIVIHDLTSESVFLTFDSEVARVLQMLFIAIILTALFIALIFIRQYNEVAPKYYQQIEDLN